MKIIGIFCFIFAAILAFLTLACIVGREEFKKINKMGKLYTFLILYPLGAVAFIYLGLNLLGVKNDLFSSNENSGTSYQTTDSSASSQEKHYCYVCGKECSYEYGGQYYCPTHGAMVKAANEGK